MTESVTATLDKLEAEVSELEANPPSNTELAELSLSARKLEYRLNILERSVAAETGSTPTDMLNIRRALQDLFSIAIREAFPQLTSPPQAVVIRGKFDDYQCDSALSLAPLLKGATGAKWTPRDVANKIVAVLLPNAIVDKTSIAGPGFINIHVRSAFAAERLRHVLRSGVAFKSGGRRRQRVIVDMSSPNIAKEMHVGHLRSTIIGEAIARICEFAGHDVLKLNHIGDWGTQFGMLIAHLRDSCDSADGGDGGVPNIVDMQVFYRESKARFDSDEVFKKRAYENVALLQSRDPVVIKYWKSICELSRKEFQKIYARLDVERLVERGESFYQDRMVQTVQELEKAGCLEEDEGRKVMFAEGHKVPLTVVKSDGSFTYDTSDMAAIKHRLNEENADWVFYVVDAGQSLHLETVYACAQRMGWYSKGAADAKRIEHVTFGVVLGEDKKKFKSRSGDVVRLRELLDEALKRSEAKLREKGRDKELTDGEFAAAREAVAYGCIKYADLAHNRQNDYVFSYDKMLDDRGNTAVYLQYAYMRIRAIARKAGVSPEALEAATAAAADANPISLEHPKEDALAKCLLRFPEMLTDVIADWSIHLIGEYLYDVSSKFTDFYGACQCIEMNADGTKTVSMSRLLLCEATAKLMRVCFDLLGLRTLERM